MPAEKPTWKCLGQEVAFENQRVRIRVDQVITPGETNTTYTVFEKRDFAMVIPLKGEDLIMVEQYRYPISMRSWEFPKGTLNPDEPALEAAKRELEEETGLRAGQIFKIGYLKNAVGISTQGYTIFLATKLIEGVQNLDDTEKDLEVKSFSLEEIRRMILKGEIIDAETVAGFQLLTLHLSSNSRPS